MVLYYGYHITWVFWSQTAVNLALFVVLYRMVALQRRMNTEMEGIIIAMRLAVRPFTTASAAASWDRMTVALDRASEAAGRRRDGT